MINVFLNEKKKIINVNIDKTKQSVPEFLCSVIQVD